MGNDNSNNNSNNRTNMIKDLLKGFYNLRIVHIIVIILSLFLIMCSCLYNTDKFSAIFSIYSVSTPILFGISKKVNNEITKGLLIMVPFIIFMISACLYDVVRNVSPSLEGFSDFVDLFSKIVGVISVVIDTRFVVETEPRS